MSLFAGRKQSSVIEDPNAEKLDRGLEKPSTVTAQEREDAALWVQQAKKLEYDLSSQGKHIKQLEKQKKEFKREQVGAQKSIKELEKKVEELKNLLKAPPMQGGGKAASSTPALSLREAAETMATLELQVDNCSLCIEEVDARIIRLGDAVMAISKLRKQIEQDLPLHYIPNADLFRTYLHELVALVGSVLKEMGSPSGQVFVIKVHHTSPLEPDVNVTHPAVLVSVIDETRADESHRRIALWSKPAASKAPQGDFLLKQHDFAVAVQQHEACSHRVDEDEQGELGTEQARVTEDTRPVQYRSDPLGCRHILPVLTRPCPLLPLALAAAQKRGSGERQTRGIQAGLSAVWEEELGFDQDPDHMLQEKVVFFFELVDFQVAVRRPDLRAPCSEPYTLSPQHLDPSLPATSLSPPPATSLPPPSSFSSPSPSALLLSPSRPCCHRRGLVTKPSTAKPRDNQRIQM